MVDQRWKKRDVVFTGDISDEILVYLACGMMNLEWTEDTVERNVFEMRHYFQFLNHSIMHSRSGIDDGEDESTVITRTSL